MLVSSHNAEGMSESTSNDATWWISLKHSIDSSSSTTPCRHRTTFSRTRKQNCGRVHWTNCSENTSSRSVCSIISMLAAVVGPTLLAHQQNNNNDKVSELLKINYTPTCSHFKTDHFPCLCFMFQQMDGMFQSNSPGGVIAKLSAKLLKRKLPRLLELELVRWQYQYANGWNKVIYEPLW